MKGGFLLKWATYFGRYFKHYYVSITLLFSFVQFKTYIVTFTTNVIASKLPLLYLLYHFFGSPFHMWGFFPFPNHTLHIVFFPFFSFLLFFHLICTKICLICIISLREAIECLKFMSIHHKMQHSSFNL